MLACFVAAVAAGCAGTADKKVSDSMAAARHPELTDQEKLTPCAACHRDITPEIYQQWYDSRHGLGKVKCFQCHGTYENFRVSPDETSCAACHNAQFQHAAKGKRCWDCHPAHGFVAHR